MISATDEHALECLGWAVLVVAWAGAMVVAWRLAARVSARRYVRYAAAAIVMWLPFWDFLPGFLAWDAASEVFGGLRVYQSVAADGYLDLSRSSGLEVWGTFAGRPYRYIEIYSSRRPLSSEVDPAYYELHLAPRDSPECAGFESSPTAQTFHRAFGLPKLCPVATRRDSPFSRYALEMSSGWQPRPLIEWFRPVEERWVRLVDRETHATLGEARVFRYRPWIDRLGLGLQFERSAGSSIDPIASRLVSAVIRPSEAP